MNSTRASARTARRSPTPIQLMLVHPARPHTVSPLTLRFALAGARSFTHWFGGSKAPMELSSEVLTPADVDWLMADERGSIRPLDRALRVAALVASLDATGLDDDLSMPDLELQDDPRQDAASARPGAALEPWLSPQGAQDSVRPSAPRIPPSRKPAVAKIVAALGVVTLNGCTAAPEAPTPLTDWSQALVESLEPSVNDYASDPTLVTWAGVGDAQESTNRSKCASFVSALFTQAYDRDLDGWLGCSSPLAATWHDQIEHQNDFEVVRQVGEIQPGDVLAIRYDDVGCASMSCGSMQGCDSSGHMAVVLSSPKRHASSAPWIRGTTQFEVDVIDSTTDVHGPTDSRVAMELDGSDDSGAGIGTMRLYADSSGAIVGHTWSTTPQSDFRDVAQRPLVIGRYAPQP